MGDEIIRSRAKLWSENGTTTVDGFVEIEDVHDGTVSLCLADEDVNEIQRAWLFPAKARRVAKALIEAADAIEGRPDA